MKKCGKTLDLRAGFYDNGIMRSPAQLSQRSMTPQAGVLDAII
jgi:hypothetical protein